MEKNRDIERLRAFAALFVVVAHVSWIQSALSHAVGLRLLPWTGVDLFFVISGFVVSAAFERDLARHAASVLPAFHALLAFMIKRAARILPTAFACIVFWLLGWNFFNRGGYFGSAFTTEQVFGIVAANALFFSNYAMVYRLVPNQLGWYWTLCVEEHFYLLYPTFRLLTPDVRRRTRALVAVALVVIVIFRNLTNDADSAQKLSHMRFDQLAFGVLLFIAQSRFAPAFEFLRSRLAVNRAARAITTVLMVVFLVVIAAVPTTVTNGAGGRDAAAEMRVGLMVTGLLSFVLVFLASFNLDLLAFGIKPLGRALVAVGARSYALYMYHVPAQWVSQELVLRHPNLLSLSNPDRSMITLYAVVVVTLVELNYRLIEQPFMALGKRGVARLAGEPREAREVAPLFPWMPPLRTIGSALAVFVAVGLMGVVAMEARLRATLQPLPGADVPHVSGSPEQAATRLRRLGFDAAAPFYPRRRAELDALPLMPLANASNRLTLLCQGHDGWLTFQSDGHGFNNPANMADAAAVDYVLLGDETLACAEPSNSVAVQLRVGGRAVLDLSVPGHGPFHELAALREYGLSKHPRLVVWGITESNDVGEFEMDASSPRLHAYLRPGFTQHLAEQQSAVDQCILGTNRPAPSLSRAGAAEWGSWGRLRALKQWWAVPPPLDPATGWFVAGLARPTFAPRPVDPPIPSQQLFVDLLARLRGDVTQEGGQVLIVVLPEKRRFFDATYTESYRPQILRLAAAVDIPALDLVEVFKEAPTPAALFDTGTEGYSSIGFRVIAAAMEKRARRLMPRTYQ